MNPQTSARIFNVITIVFLVLTVVVVVWGVSRLMGPNLRPPADVIIIPTPLQLPTATPTHTPTSTPLPTFTPTATDTLTPTVTFTPSPTISPTFTITSTPAPSATPGPSATPTLPPSPTGPTDTPPPPFPFALRDNQVILTNNDINSQGCNWQGIGGQVFDLQGNAFPNLRVSVSDGAGTFQEFAVTGSNTLYGESGWEVPVGTAAENRTFFVELRSGEGTPISPVVQITFPGQCDSNRAIVNFTQVRPF